MLVGLLLLLLAATVTIKTAIHPWDADLNVSYTKPLTSKHRDAGQKLPSTTSLHHQDPPHISPDENGNMSTSDGRNYIDDSYFLWRKNFIPYKIKCNLNKQKCDEARHLIKEATSHIEDMTNCITFAEVKWLSPPYADIIIDETGGCSSGVGYHYWIQTVHLNHPGCMSFNTIVHELMHLMGGHHEQNRADRDFYIHIGWANIIKDDKSQFYKTTSYSMAKHYDPDCADNPDSCYTGEETRGLGMYDFKSRLHYGAYDFSANKEPTIYSFVPNKMKPSRGLSEWDIYKIQHSVCAVSRKQTDSTIHLAENAYAPFQVLTGTGGRVNGNHAYGWSGEIMVEYGYVIDFYLALRKVYSSCLASFRDPYDHHKAVCVFDEGFRRTHGNRLIVESAVPFYLVWRRIKQRCCSSITLRGPTFPLFEGNYLKVGTDEYRTDRSFARFSLVRDNLTTLWWFVPERPDKKFRANGYILCPEHITASEFTSYPIYGECITRCPISNGKSSIAVGSGIMVGGGSPEKYNEQFNGAKICQEDGTWSSLMIVYCKEFYMYRCTP